MNVDVRYFAAAREAVGRASESLALEPGATVASLRDRLFETHAGLRALEPGLRFAIGERFADGDAPLADGDRVALLPPVSGGQVFTVAETPVDAEAVRRAVEGPRSGAVVVFHGTVRDRTADRRVTHLEYEAYVPMAEAAMAEIGAEVVARHGLTALACAHRTGRLEIGEVAVVVATSAPHRQAALEAVDDYVRRLKQDVPIWKKEHFEGGAVWIGTPEDPQGRGPASKG